MRRRDVVRAIIASVGGVAGSVWLRGSTLASEPAIATTAAGKIRGNPGEWDLLVQGRALRRRYRHAALSSASAASAVEWRARGDQFGAIAPQPGIRDRAQGEDCLHLNVWTPAVRDNGRRPVMVWFHPGAYSSGTSNETEATARV